MQVIVFSGVNHIIIHDLSRPHVYCLSKQNVSYKISINVLFYVNDYMQDDFQIFSFFNNHVPCINTILSKIQTCTYMLLPYYGSPVCAE